MGLHSWNLRCALRFHVVAAGQPVASCREYRPKFGTGETCLAAAAVAHCPCAMYSNLLYCLVGVWFGTPWASAQGVLVASSVSSCCVVVLGWQAAFPSKACVVTFLSNALVLPYLYVLWCGAVR